tara:strand:+ start:7633 stop:8496 length:864 start_codon:yes stop_codon:yes gene_type:complete
MNTYKLIPLFLISFLFCQFNNVTINIEYNENDSDYNTKRNIIDRFDEQIKEYFLLNNFCQEFDFIEVDIKINLIIESINIISNNTGTTNQIISHLLISNNKDLYYFDKGVVFEYSKNKALTYNPYHLKGLETIFDYYAFLFIGYELDTWGHSLGTKYINKAYQISSELGYSSNWENREKEIQIILDNTMLRETRFYYYKYLDIIYSEDYIKNATNYKQQIKETIEQLYSNLVRIYEKLGNDKNTLKFINSISEEIALIFNNLEMNDALEFLIDFDNDNKNIYKKYLR